MAEEPGQPDNDQAFIEEIAEEKDDTSSNPGDSQTSSNAKETAPVSKEEAEEKDETSLNPGDGQTSSNAEEPAQVSKEEGGILEQVSSQINYGPLHKAALNGDWESAERFLIENPDADITQRLNRDGMSLLVVAANMGHAVFMTKLVQSRFFRKEALRSKDKDGYTALHYATLGGSLSCVKFLISQDNTLTQIPNRISRVPLHLVTDASKQLVWYLTKKTTNDDPAAPFSGANGAYLIFSLVTLGYTDICLYLFNRYPQLATDCGNDWKADSKNDLLLGLADWASEFPSGSKFNFWERCIYHLIPIGTQLSVRRDSKNQWKSSILRIVSNMAKVTGLKHIGDEKYKHQCIIELLKVGCEIVSKWNVEDIDSYLGDRGIHLGAAETGGTEIITALIQHFPHFMDYFNVEVNILLRAIKNRQDNVYNLMMERGITVTFLPVYQDNETEENALHITAKLAPYARLSSVSCPALQMQRELQWFKGVEKFLRPSYRVNRNKDDEIPREVFTREHKELVGDAEKWLKDTASSCLVVATLIITVVFAAAFTIPGGNIEGIGIPLFLRRNEFLVFAISDAIGMFSAATSILMFLSILTARYAEDDFLTALPKRLIFGLVSLLIALASMMVTFGATLYIVLNPRFNWIIFPIICLTCIPVGIFIMLQLPLIIFMIRSTYGPGVIKNKIMSVK